MNCRREPLIQFSEASTILVVEFLICRKKSESCKIMSSVIYNLVEKVCTLGLNSKTCETKFLKKL